jgi:hypothetical protein
MPFKFDSHPEDDRITETCWMQSAVYMDETCLLWSGSLLNETRVYSFLRHVSILSLNVTTLWSHRPGGLTPNCPYSSKSSSLRWMPPVPGMDAESPCTQVMDRSVQSLVMPVKENAKCTQLQCVRLRELADAGLQCVCACVRLPMQVFSACAHAWACWCRPEQETPGFQVAVA